MDMICSKAQLHGAIQAPPSKSASHRAILCAALANGTSRLQNCALSDDIAATTDAIKALGAKVVYDSATQSMEIQGIELSQKPSEQVLINCRESGSTLRFLLPVAAALGQSAVFHGCGKLPSRPLDPLIQLLTSHGCHTDYKGTMPFSIEGQLQGGCYIIPGNISSQFVTGLLFAAPLLNKPVQIQLTTPLASKPYVDMTINILKVFSIAVQQLKDSYFVPGNQVFQCRESMIEGDYSNAAFFLAAAAAGSQIRMQNLPQQTAQGDQAILPILRQFGADILLQNGSVLIKPGTDGFQGIEIDGEQIPDLIPILAVTAALSQGTTIMRNVGRLRMKECDRLEAVSDGLTRLGGNVTVDGDTLIVHGSGRLHGGTVSGYGDHRIVMSMAIAALGCEEDVTITGCEAVRKSYPNFFQDYISLGGVCHAVRME